MAAVGIPAVIAAAWVGGWLLAALLGLVAAAAYAEFARMTGITQSHRGLTAFGAVGCLAFPLVVRYWGVGGGAGLATLAVVALPALAMWGPAGPLRLAAGVKAAFGVLYVGGLLSFGTALRDGQGLGGAGSMALFLLPVVTVWGSDTAAYFGGKALGRRKLSPRISPGKTVEGAVAGVLAAAGVSTVCARWALEGTWTRGWVAAAAVGALIGIAAALGDLVESALKRQRGIKDSSKALPGHGGFLDRIDSMLWALPCCYFMMWLLL